MMESAVYILVSFVLALCMAEILLPYVSGLTGNTLSPGVLFAWPSVWLAYNRWLDNFAYRQDVNYFIFIAAPLIALGAAWITISYHTYRAASANPANALKQE